MCHVSGSSVATLSDTPSAPGLMVPVMALPSQFRSRTTCVRLPGPLPQSPLHVPLRGWPNCAKAVVVTVKRNATTVRKRNERTILGVLSCCLLLATRGLRLATRGLRLATRGSLLAARGSLLAARYSLLAARYSRLATCYFSLLTS